MAKARMTLERLMSGFGWKERPRVFRKGVLTAAAQLTRLLQKDHAWLQSEE